MAILATEVTLAEMNEILMAWRITGVVMTGEGNRQAIHVRRLETRRAEVKCLVEIRDAAAQTITRLHLKYIR